MWHAIGRAVADVVWCRAGLLLMRYDIGVTYKKLSAVAASGYCYCERWRRW